MTVPANYGTEYSIFFLDKDKLFGNRTSKNFDALARGTSENF